MDLSLLYESDVSTINVIESSLIPKSAETDDSQNSLLLDFMNLDSSVDEETAKGDIQAQMEELTNKLAELKTKLRDKSTEKDNEAVSFQQRLDAQQVVINDLEKELDTCKLKVDELTSKGIENEYRRQGARDTFNAIIELVLGDELQCSICNELLLSAVTTNCSHSFCQLCIEEWRRARDDDSCPLCRAQLTNVTPTLTIDSFLDNILQQCAPNLYNERVAKKQNRGEV